MKNHTNYTDYYFLRNNLFIAHAMPSFGSLICRSIPIIPIYLTIAMHRSRDKKDTHIFVIHEFVSSLHGILYFNRINKMNHLV